MNKCVWWEQGAIRCCLCNYSCITKWKCAPPTHPTSWWCLIQESIEIPLTVLWQFSTPSPSPCSGLVSRRAKRLTSPSPFCLSLTYGQYRFLLKRHLLLCLVILHHFPSTSSTEAWIKHPFPILLKFSPMLHTCYGDISNCASSL